MENLKEKINKYINNKGLLKTPVHYIKELLIGIIDKIDDTVDKVEDVVEGSIELINETLKVTINTTIELNIIPYVRNKIVFDTEELNIDIKNGYYYNDNLLENLKITKSDDTICPKVEFNGYYIKLQLPKSVVLLNKFVNYDGFAKYIINFDNNNCKIDKYKNDVSDYLVVTYSEGTTDLSHNDSMVFTSLDRKYINNVGPVYENERLITKVGTTIDGSAFWECLGLTSVVIPKSVNSIGSYAFYNCDSLTSVEIGNSVTSIGSNAFWSCSGLTSITIPDSVTSIGNDAFDGCSGLTSIVIPNSVNSIGDNAFSNCSGLRSVEIGNSVTSIGDEAFGYCRGLTFITIPDSVTSISNTVFAGCSRLIYIIVDESNPKYDSRGNCNAIIETETNTLISGCKNTIIPDSVTSIGDKAFGGCTELTSIEIPNSVTSIGDEVFSSCNELTSVVIGNSVTSIGDGVFSYCYELTSVTMSSIVPPSLGVDAFPSTYSSKLIIYVPDDSVDAYKNATNWSSYSDKIKPLSEKPV